MSDSSVEQKHPPSASSSIPQSSSVINPAVSSLMNSDINSVQIFQQMQELLSYKDDEQFLINNQPIKSKQSSTLVSILLERFEKQAQVDRHLDAAVTFTFCMAYDPESDQLIVWLNNVSVSAFPEFVDFFNEAFNLFVSIVSKDPKYHKQFCVDYYSPSYFNVVECNKQLSIENPISSISSIADLSILHNYYFITVTACSTASFQSKPELRSSSALSKRFHLSNESIIRNLNTKWILFAQCLEINNQRTNCLPFNQSLSVIANDNIGQNVNQYTDIHSLIRDVQLEQEKINQQLNSMDLNSIDEADKIKTVQLQYSKDVLQNLIDKWKQKVSQVRNITNQYSNKVQASSSWMAACAHYLNSSLFSPNEGNHDHNVNLFINGINLPSVFFSPAGSFEDKQFDSSCLTFELKEQTVVSVIEYLNSYPILLYFLVTRPNCVILIPFFLEKPGGFWRHLMDIRVREWMGQEKRVQTIDKRMVDS